MLELQFTYALQFFCSPAMHFGNPFVKSVHHTYGLLGGGIQQRSWDPDEAWLATAVVFLGHVMAVCEKSLICPEMKNAHEIQHQTILYKILFWQESLRMAGNLGVSEAKTNAAEDSALHTWAERPTR